MCGRKSEGTFSQRFSLLLLVLLALVLSCITLPYLSAQESTPSEQPTIGSIISIASVLKQDSQTLKQRLTDRKQQADAQAQNSQATAQQSAALSPQSDKTQAAIDNSQAASTETSSSVSASQKTASDLSQDFDKYKKDSDAKIASLEFSLGICKGVAVTAGVVSLGLLGYEGGRALHFWQ